MIEFYVVNEKWPTLAKASKDKVFPTGLVSPTILKLQYVIG